MRSPRNQQTYNLPSTIRHYANHNDLQKPEQAILYLLQDELREFSMLDVGVGTGRTTEHFVPLVKNYLGIDNAEQMIRYCNEHYPQVPFEQVDIVDLNKFPSNSYDFILISFNSLDYINQEERLTALHEIRRICKPNGYFVFSTHNINSLPKLYKFEFRLNVWAIIKNIYKRFRVKALNGGLASFISQKYEIINDGEFNFGLETYYSLPSFTIQQIKDVGFPDIKTFNLEGKELLTDEEIKSNEDFYLYFMCR